MKKHIIVDVESNGPLQGIHSIVSFGMVLLDEKLDNTFYREIAPITDVYDPEALAVSGFTFEETKNFMDPAKAMAEASEWVNSLGDDRKIFWSDNNGYDFPWMNWYFLRFVGKNPFGWSSRRIGDVYCGMERNAYAGWKKFRKFNHTHNALDDAKGNASALWEFKKMGFKM